MRAVKCPKCQAMCLLAMVDGFKAAVDPAPLDAEAVRAALVAGRSVYTPWYGFRRRSQPEGPPLRGMHLMTPSALGARLKLGMPIHGEHGCGNRAFSGVPIDAPAKPLSGPLCRSGVAGGPGDCPRLAAARTGQPLPSSCQECDPAPFEQEASAAWLMRMELGATVVSIEIEGRNVYSRP